VTGREVISVLWKDKWMDDWALLGE